MSAAFHHKPVRSGHDLHCPFAVHSIQLFATLNHAVTRVRFPSSAPNIEERQ